MALKNKFGILAICLVLSSSIMLGCIEQETQKLQTEQALTLGSYTDFKAAIEGRSIIFETLTGVDENEQRKE